jgi:hypothetical protein
MVDTSIFGRLKRLFSQDVIIRNVGGNQLKVMDTDRIQSTGQVRTNALIDRYQKIHRGTSMPYNPTINYQAIRAQLYQDYEAMDTESIIASALDIIADECSLKNEAGEVLQIRSSDENVQQILYNLFYDILNIEFNLWTWTRNMCKYGDFYLHLEIAEKFGIFNVTPLSSYDMVREERYDAENPNAVKFRIDPTYLQGVGTQQYSRPMKEGRVEFDNYEIAHFRLLADANWLPYGRSFIEPGRKTYKMYALTKDAMLLHRIMRAPEKRIFYMNIGNIPPNEVDAYMQKVKNNMKKAPHIDPLTGDYNLKFNVQNMLEDFYIPIRGNDQTTKIDTLKGLEYNGIDDVNFLRDELLAALKVPKAFFGFEKDLQGKATLAAEDIRFARTVERIQRILTSELYKIALVHLYVQGYDGEALTNFELSLTSPSVVFQQEKVALWKEKIDLAKSMQDTKLIPSDYIYDKIFELSEDQIEELRDLVVEDKRREFRLSQIENEGNDPAKTGKSFGTPHDLAALYGKGRMNADSENLPAGYDEVRPVDGVGLGRPEEKASMINTQDDPLGKDRLGRGELTMPGTVKSANNSDSVNFKGGSPLALSEFLRNKQMLRGIPRPNEKKIIYEGEDKEGGLLDERNIKDTEA